MGSAEPLLGRMSAWLRRWRDCGRRLVAACLGHVRRWLRVRRVPVAEPGKPARSAEPHGIATDSPAAQPAVEPPGRRPATPRRRDTKARKPKARKPRRTRPAEPAAVPPPATSEQPAPGGWVGVFDDPDGTPPTITGSAQSLRPSHPPQPTAPPSPRLSLTPDEVLRLVTLLMEEERVHNAGSQTPPPWLTDDEAESRTGSLWLCLLAAILGWSVSQRLDLPALLFPHEPDGTIPQEPPERDAERWPEHETAPGRVAISRMDQPCPRAFPQSTRQDRPLREWSAVRMTMGPATRHSPRSPPADV
jgi:hypothetical protein